MKKTKKAKNIIKSNISRPPIVAVLGHVDHGKTTLLDTIRKSNQVAKEFGGITQHIGAYQIEVETKEGKRKITFIDTPGHEAFSEMRSRGAQVTDLVILVVSAVEGVKPQTEESIKHIKQAKVPFIVAATKMDLPEANIDRVKKQLSKVGVLTEGYGGDVVVVPVSAITKTGITQLLEMIILVCEMQGIKGSDSDPFSAVVIESKMDHQRGPTATILVKTGQMKVQDEVFLNEQKVKIRAMFDEFGKIVNIAGPSRPVDVLGFSKVPVVGSLITKEALAPVLGQIHKPVFFPADKKHLKIIFKADTYGSLETIVKVLAKNIEIIEAGMGDIGEADVLKAKATNSLIIGFNVRIGKSTKILVEQEKVLVKTYNIIYELLEELIEVAHIVEEGEKEIILGKANIVAIFPSDGVKIAGILVIEGKFSKGDKVKLVRNNTDIGTGRILNLRLGKEDTDKVEQGKECGAKLSANLDFQARDMLLSIKTPEIKLK